jgi:hypothetical protein
LFFKKGYKTDLFKMIDYSKIICKCIAIEIYKDEQYFYLSDYLIEKEHYYFFLI